MTVFSLMNIEGRFFSNQKNVLSKTVVGIHTKIDTFLLSNFQCNFSVSDRSISGEKMMKTNPTDSNVKL